MKSILLFVIALSVAACDDSAGAKRAVEALGIKAVETHGYAWFGCDDNDTFQTKFTGVNPAGQHVSGVVCSGLFKDSTVRFR